MRNPNRCLICGGNFALRPHTVIEETTGESKVVRRRQCVRCGDTEFSPEQFTVGRYRNRKAKPRNRKDPDA